MNNLPQQPQAPLARIRHALHTARVKRSATSALPTAACLTAALLLAGCAHPHVPRVRFAREMPPSRPLVQRALNTFPRRLNQSFFAAVDVLGKRFTALGRLHSAGHNHFQLTVATEMGQLLFEARYSAHGFHLVRITRRISPSAAKWICTNVRLALRAPHSARGLRMHRYFSVLHRRDAAGHAFTYTFAGRRGRLVKDRIGLSLFDTLHVQYRRYQKNGLPQEIVLYRPLEDTLLEITFTGPA